MIVASAPGKINIFFAVGSLLQNGYHEVASVYQALNIRERVIASESTDWQVQVSGPLSAEQLAGVPTDKNNLVIQAAEAIAQVCSIEDPRPVHFGIAKNVPVAGGMGGGSADAAAALMAVDELWQTRTAGKVMFRLAARLGADVPFALVGGTAIGLGHGEQLESIDGVKKLHWVLVANDAGLSTPDVYRRLDKLREQRGESIIDLPKPQVPTELLEALRSGEPSQVAPLLRNDLQEAAISLMPELGDTIAAGVAAGALAGIVSGSGPTVALLVPSAEVAQEVANRLAVAGHLAMPTFGPAPGTILEQG